MLFHVSIRFREAANVVVIFVHVPFLICFPTPVGKLV